MQPREQDETNDFSELAKEVAELRAQIAELKESERFWQDRAEKFKEEKKLIESGIKDKVISYDSNNETKEINSTATKKNPSVQQELSNLITGTPSKDKSSEWELARDIFVQDIDKQEIGGVIDSVIENIETAYTSKISDKDRGWVRSHLKAVASEMHANNIELVMSKTGLRIGNIEDLRSGIDAVNLLPVFGNEIAMRSIIELAKNNEAEDLNEPEAVTKLLESLILKAKATKASL
jgi:hypothetical protein